ncbi:MAG: PAS domain S-box protein, partial [Woeseiaceae bacterium]
MKSSISRCHAVWVVLLTAVIAAAMLYSSWSEVNAAQNDANQLRATISIELKATSAHLRLHEVLDGKRHVDLERIARDLTQAQWYARAMLVGGQNVDGPITPVQDPDLHGSMERALDKIRSMATLAEVLRRTVTDPGGATVATTNVQPFETTFEALTRTLDRAKSTVQQRMQSRLQHFRVVQALLAVPVVILGTLAGFLLRNHERRRVADVRALQDQEESLSATLHSIGDGVIATDTRGKITRMNPVAEKLTGWRVEQAMGKPLSLVFRNLNGVTRILPEDPVAQVLEHGNLVELPQHTVLVAKDSTEHNIADSAAPICNAAGEVTGVVVVFRDITEEYLVRRQIAEREVRFRNLFEQSGQGIAVYDHHGRILEVNEKLAALLGYPRAQLLSAGINELYPQPEQPGCVALEGVLSNGFTQFETALVTRAGTVIDVSVTSTVIEYNGERLILIELQAQRAEALIELPKAAEELDEDGVMQRGRELMEELTGSRISCVHFVGGDDPALEIDPQSRAEPDHHKRAVYDKHDLLEQAGIRADAFRCNEMVIVNDYANHPGKRDPSDGFSELKRLISVPLIERGKVVMLSGLANKDKNYSALDAETVQLVSDAVWRIVQRKRSLTELASKEARYRELVENMSGGVAVYRAVDAGQDFVLRELNPAGERIVNQRREKLIGQRVTDAFPGVRSIGLLDVFQRVWQTDSPETLPPRLYKDEAVQIYVDNFVFKLPSGDLVAFFEDITEHKQTEQALRRAQKMDALGKLTGGIAHDFNNILGIILGNLDLLDLDTIENEKARRRVGSIRKSAERAASLTKQLLGFSRHQSAEVAVTDVNQVSVGMEHLIARSVTPEVIVERQLAGNLWSTEIDAGDLEDTLV